MLEQWAAEKLNFNEACADSDTLEIPESTSHTSKMDIKREWDRLTEADGDNCLISVADTTHPGHASSKSKQLKTSGRKSATELYSH